MPRLGHSAKSCSLRHLLDFSLYTFAIQKTGVQGLSGFLFFFFLAYIHYHHGGMFQKEESLVLFTCISLSLFASAAFACRILTSNKTALIDGWKSNLCGLFSELEGVQQTADLLLCCCLEGRGTLDGRTTLNEQALGA